MRYSKLALEFFTIVLVALAIGCGGGGGAAPLPGATLLATLKADLLGSQETTVVDPAARGTAILELMSDGRLRFGCAAQSGYVGEIVGAHIHRGAAGADGPIEVDLLGGGAAFDPDTLATSDTLGISPVLAGEIAATPEAFYVNIHTTAAPNGLVRDQLAVLGPLHAHATLLGSEEVPVADSDARGAATFHVGADRQVTYRLGMQSPAVTDILSAHIHAGSAGVNGPVVIDLEPGSATLNGATNLLEGTGTASLEQLARLCNDLAGFYANVHTASAPAGVARGQLGQQPITFWSALSAEQEVTPPSDLAGRGGATVQFRSFSEGTVHMAVPISQGIINVTAAHIHRGDAGVDGPVEVDLMAGADFTASFLSFSAEGTIGCSQDLFTELLIDHTAFYFNFHTADDPTGAVRGQLSRDPATFVAVMSGDEEVTVVDPDAAGNTIVVVNDVFDCSFTVNMTSPEAGTLTAGHVHDGAPAVNGPVLIDLLGGQNVQLSEDSITGDSMFTGRTFARLLAFPERFYANMHTDLAPAGICRGQFLHLTEDTPPAGLTYATPVTYTEGVLITNNVPTSVGGAISSFSVDPPLPAGLNLHPTTGVITGTPSGASAAADFAVTASNASGADVATVNITVDAAPPTNLTYASPATYTVNTPIPTNSPSNTGGAITSYTVSPALPAGLSLNPTTGDITGTPSGAAAAADYRVTGSNAASSAFFDVNITVNAALQPPSSLSYVTPNVYTTGTAIATNSPTISGGAVATWSISPALSAGLNFSTVNGDITGTPTALAAQTDYTVTASNAAGSTQATVRITVNLGAPANLAYSNNPNIGYINTAIAAMSPSSTGGAVTSYSITPALPAGLSFSTTTGVVSGTPTAVTAQTNYTVTATNAAGNTTATITIVVY